MLGIVLDIWKSFRALPLWVQVWMAVILVPANLASIVFVGEPNSVLIAVLAIGGMAVNLPIMLIERGFSKAMALPHLVAWTPLVVILFVQATSGDGSTEFLRFALLLTVIDAISLGFDYSDAWKWWRGDRAVAGRV